MRNCFTVDVEDWFHVCGVGAEIACARWSELPSRVVQTTRDLLDLLNRCEIRGTFFVLGWVAERYPLLVDEIVKGGHEIASHGHLHQRVYELSPARFVQDLEASRAALAAAGAASIKGYRAPEWSINRRSLWALDLLADAGFRFDSSMAPMKIVGDPGFPQHPHARQTSAGVMIEFPPMVDTRFGQNMPLGGGWGLRMSSPDRVIRAIDDRNQRGTPVTLVVHPWEIDPDPPRISLPLPQHFAHYFRLSGFRRRLEQILKGASFAPMGEVLALNPIQT